MKLKVRKFVMLKKFDLALRKYITKIDSDVITSRIPRFTLNKDANGNYILNEKNLASKMEIVYYLSKKENIYFDKSVIFKTELARIFLKYNKLELDENLVLTASLLCNCKKVENVRKIEEINCIETTEKAAYWAAFSS